MKERRRLARVLIRRAVDVSWDLGRAEGWGRNISLGGMYVQSQARPDAGAKVHVTVRLRRGAPLSMPARVCRNDEGGFAVQFVAVGQLEAGTLRKLVEGS